MRTVVKAVMAAALMASGAATLAQDWKAERAAGRVGEQPDGYLGVVGGGNPTLEKLVADVNALRKRQYFARAGQDTPELFAKITGCSQIVGLGPNEMYQTPAGAWRKRGTGTPDLLSICPAGAN